MSCQPKPGSCPSGSCCLKPGPGYGCQGEQRCPGANPQNYTPCGFSFVNKSSGISLQDLKDIKAALHGKTVDVHGVVDHASPSTTPHLRLHTTWYYPENERVKHGTALTDGVFELLDGVNFWMGGSVQNASAPNYTRGVRELRQLAGQLERAARDNEEGRALEP